MRGFITFATLLWAGAALAMPPDPQQLCDYERVLAWRRYTFCVNGKLPPDAKGVGLLDGTKQFWTCRHRYFDKWARLQTKPSLAGSTCTGSRFADNGDGSCRFSRPRSLLR